MGDWKTFNRTYVKPIEAGRKPTAAKHQKEQGDETNRKLQALIKPHMLRRNRKGFLQLPSISEFDVWIKLSSHQRSLYKNFVTTRTNSGMIEEGWKCCLPAIHRLRELVNHPLLFLQNVSEDGMKSAKQQMESMKHIDIIDQSPKLKLLFELLRQWRREDAKALVFSYSVQMLDIIQHVLPSIPEIEACRIDGSASTRRREQLVNNFNSENSTCHVMLLSIETGGEGLNLTGASKSVLFDPPWNQAKTDQAAARTCRPGQTQECECISFLTAGSVEEKMLGKQIYKGSIDRFVFGNNDNTNQRGVYDKDALTKLFHLDEDGQCHSLKHFQKSHHGTCQNKHKCSIKENNPLVIGISQRNAIYND